MKKGKKIFRKLDKKAKLSEANESKYYIPYSEYMEIKQKYGTVDLSTFLKNRQENGARGTQNNRTV